MKPGNHEPLDRLLRRWQVSASPSSHFQVRVWERIRSGEMEQGTSLWLLFRNVVEHLFEHPAAGVSYVVLLSVLGLGVGYVRGETKAAETRSELAQRYLQSIDPYQVPR